MLEVPFGFLKFIFPFQNLKKVNEGHIPKIFVCQFNVFQVCSEYELGEGPPKFFLFFSCHLVCILKKLFLKFWSLLINFPQSQCLNFVNKVGMIVCFL